MFAFAPATAPKQFKNLTDWLLIFEENDDPYIELNDI